MSYYFLTITLLSLESLDSGCAARTIAIPTS